jgi:UDP-N-acetylmuramoyl-L-alanyl-D-glutamate--2,6-diaminopimelate ligase
MRRRELGEVAARLADHAILTSDNPAAEDPNAIIDEIAEAFVGGSATYEKIPDRRYAIEHAVSLLQDGEILVLAGKGHEEYQLIGTEKIPFSERNILESVSTVSMS